MSNISKIISPPSPPSSASNSLSTSSQFVGLSKLNNKRKASMSEESNVPVKQQKESDTSYNSDLLINSHTSSSEADVQTAITQSNEPSALLNQERQAIVINAFKYFFETLSRNNITISEIQKTLDNSLQQLSVAPSPVPLNLSSNNEIPLLIPTISPARDTLDASIKRNIRNSVRNVCKKIIGGEDGRSFSIKSLKANFDNETTLMRNSMIRNLKEATYLGGKHKVETLPDNSLGKILAIKDDDSLFDIYKKQINYFWDKMSSEDQSFLTEKFSELIPESQQSSI